VTLRQKIEHEIRERGAIPFSRYMEMCLYDPELGYYSRQTEQFGKAGDFYTSSDVHAVFGRLLARQFDEMWRMLGSPNQIEVLELGPGRGLFAQDVLDWSQKKFPEFFHALHYSLEENSPTLRHRMEVTLGEHFASGKASLTQRLKPPPREASYGTAEAVLLHGDTPTSNSNLREKKKGATSEACAEPTQRVPQSVNIALAPEAPVIIFANEFFDALPVEVLSSQGELRISLRNGRFVETWAPASVEELEFLDRYGVQPEAAERVEVPLAAQDYMSRITAAMNCGFIVVIDYGYLREEQLAGRHRGTVTAFRQHAISASPYEAPGEQDITAHVNFTALAAAGEHNGMQTQPLLTQSQFLMGIGERNQFADAFEECRLPQEKAKVALQLKHLITPAGMGENFHLLIGSKSVDIDKVARLSGLSFAKSRIWQSAAQDRG
jgi:SAM-dependent MidA family methyltransferase